MTTIRRILCPTDFSECSDFALQQAIRLAKWSEAEISALHVAEVIPDAERSHGVFPGLGPLEPGARRELEQALKAYLAPAERSGIRTGAVLKEGNPAREILRHASECSADFMVMGTHGRQGFERLMIGSVTEKVLRRSPVPVLTVSRRPEPPGASDEPPFRNILVPIDFSEASQRALAFASTLAKETKAALSLLHVVEILPDWEARELSHFNVPEFARHLEKEALESLRRMASEASPKGDKPEALVARGKAYKEILRIAEQRSVDLIVMGMQGRGALDLMLFGSTTGHVVRAAVCPVLAIRAA